MNDKQHDLVRSLTWPSYYGGTSTTTDIVLSINGVKVFIYPSGKFAILAVDDSDMARQAEQVLTTKFADKMLGEGVATYYRDPLRALEAQRQRWQDLIDYMNAKGEGDTSWLADVRKRIDRIDAAIDAYNNA